LRRDKRSARRGIATVSCLSAYPSDRPSVCASDVSWSQDRLDYSENEYTDGDLVAEKHPQMSGGMHRRHRHSVTNNVCHQRNTETHW